MTDFYTAARDRENEIIQRIRKQLEDYQIEAVSYTHLRAHET